MEAVSSSETPVSTDKHTACHKSEACNLRLNLSTDSFIYKKCTYGPNPTETFGSAARSCHLESKAPDCVGIVND